MITLKVAATERPPPGSDPTALASAGWEGFAQGWRLLRPPKPRAPRRVWAVRLRAHPGHETRRKCPARYALALGLALASGTGVHRLPARAAKTPTRTVSFHAPDDWADTPARVVRAWLLVGIRAAHRDPALLPTPATPAGAHRIKVRLPVAEDDLLYAIPWIGTRAALLRSAGALGRSLMPVPMAPAGDRA